MEDTIYCLTSSEPQANAILTELRNHGFTTSEISVLLRDTRDTRDISLKENTLKGAETGGLLGGFLGGLAGLSVLVIPGAGPFLALGPVLFALSGAVVGGVVGGLAGGTGALGPLGLSHEMEKHVRRRLDEGDMLIAVHSTVNATLEKAAQIFRSAGAEEVYYVKRPAA